MRKRCLAGMKYQANPRFLEGRKNIAIYSILAIGLFCLLADASEISPDETTTRVIQNGILKGKLVMQLRSEEVFTEKLIKFLNRGFTVKIEYKIELWRARRLWFDYLDSQQNISYQLNFNPIEKQYICLKTQQEKAIASMLDRQLGEIARWITQPTTPLTVAPVESLDQTASYYYGIEILIATLTTENIRDLQKWLGEFGEEEERSTLTKTTFRVARDFLSSRNNNRLSVRTERFRLDNLPELSSTSEPQSPSVQ